MLAGKEVILISRRWTKTEKIKRKIENRQEDKRREKDEKDWKTKRAFRGEREMIGGDSREAVRYNTNLLEAI